MTGIKMTYREVEEGRHEVTFSLPGDERSGETIDETCSRCPCLSVCLRGSECVRGTAYAMDGR